MDRTYPQGVTCWIDYETPEVDAAVAFYGELLGWSFTDVLPEQAPGRYAIGNSAGQDTGAIGTPSPEVAGRAAGWNTYIAVDDVEAMTSVLAAGGAEVVIPPQDAGPGGRLAGLVDPGGAAFRLWQARRRPGAQAVNVPGAWNFSDLRLRDPADLDFYVAAFGWETEPQEPWATMIRVPGFGDHLEATVDPDIRERQKFAPDGFEDTIGGALPAQEGEPPHWHVTFSVADRDASAATAERLGATVTGTDESEWTHTAEVRDPWGGVFSLSQFKALE